MLTRLQYEVLSNGPTAVLPQNLNDRWLEILQEHADDFLNANYDLDACRVPDDVDAPMLTACVQALLSEQNLQLSDISTHELAEKLTIYALWLTIETTGRDIDLPIHRPKVDTIFSWDNIQKLRTLNPQFIDALERSCILRRPGKTWFQQLKEKFLTGSQ